MVKHIILWKLKEEHNNQDVKNGIKQGLEGLMGKISGLLEIKVQIKTLESSNNRSPIAMRLRLIATRAICFSR